MDDAVGVHVVNGGDNRTDHTCCISLRVSSVANDGLEELPALA